MIYPTRRLVLSAAFPAVLSLLLVGWPSLLPAILAIDGLILLIWIWDLASMPRVHWFSSQRTMPKVMSHDHWHDAELRLDISSPKPMVLSIWEKLPVSFEVKDLPHEFDVIGRERVVLPYQVKPLRRGSHEVTGTCLLAGTARGFWRRSIWLANETHVKVYPNLRRLESFRLLARANREGMMGVKKVKRLGGDQEFDRLRDYIKGDEYRDIDWKATAKRRSLTVRSYRQEENQNIIIMLDCGRMMTSVEDDLSLLDHSINASLLMSHIALKQGDRVGMLAFASNLMAQVPVKGGMNHLKHLIHASYDLFPRHEETHFDQAFLKVAGTFKKRALLILITHILDEVNADRVSTHLTQLTGKHLPLCVSYEDPALQQVISQPVDTEKSFYELAAAAQIGEWKRKVLADLKSKGVLVLETPPQGLSAALINSYLEVKARHLL